MYCNCARDRVTPGELKRAGERPKRSRVSYHISEQTAKKSDGHFDPSLSLPLNGSLLSPEPVVVEVSPDPSASTMTGGAESSSLSETLDHRQTTDTPGCFCWCGSCQVSERVRFEVVISDVHRPMVLDLREERNLRLVIRCTDAALSVLFSPETQRR
jgi:hypothetical protein